MAPRKLKPRSRKIRESFCEDLLPRKLAKETFKAQNPGFKYVCRQLPQASSDVSGSIRIHYSQISLDVTRKSAKASRKLRERSAKALTSWDALPLPFDRGVAVPTKIWRSWCLVVPTEIWRSRLRSGSAHWNLALAVEVRQCPLRSGARGWGWGGGRGGEGGGTPDAISIHMLPQW